MRMGVRLKANFVRTPCEGVAWQVLKRSLDVANIVLKACPCAVLGCLHYVPNPPFNCQAIVVRSFLYGRIDTFLLLCLDQFHDMQVPTHQGLPVPPRLTHVRDEILLLAPLGEVLLPPQRRRRLLQALRHNVRITIDGRGPANPRCQVLTSLFHLLWIASERGA